MKQQLPVYIDRLREGQNEPVDEIVEPQRLELSDDEISVTKPFKVTGEVYVVEEYLVVSLTIIGQLSLICRLCNEPFVFPISIKKAQEEISLDEIKDACYDLLPLIRELVLLEIPLYPQCSGSSCGNREKIEKFLKNPNEQLNMPFKDLL